MGLIKRLKELFDARKYIQRAMENQDLLNERYAAMSPDELARLSDDDLYTAVLYRMDCEIRLHGKNPGGEISVCMAELSHIKRTVYLLSAMDAEAYTDTLSRFLIHTCRGLVGELIGCLREVGADQHLSLLEDFSARSQLDLTALPVFESETSPSYLEWKAQYPFEQLDTSYAGLPSLEANLTPFIRLHLAEF